MASSPFLSKDGAPEILVVDDDVGHSESVSNLLRAHGYRVEREQEGRRGLERVRADAVDILILDLRMPGMSGTEVLDRLRVDAPHVKTIVLSGESDLSEIAPILRLGAYDYLPKPYDPAQLIGSVRRAADSARLEREHAEIVEARESDHRRHAFLVNASPDLIYLLDAEGRVAFVNDRLAERFGVDRGSVVGRHWSQLVPDGLRDVLRHRLDERRTGERATRALEFVLGDGADARILELSALGLYQQADGGREFGGTYGVVRDVTESRRAERALTQSQQKFQALFVNSPDAVFISALDSGRLVEGNENFRRMMSALGTDAIESDLAVWGDVAARRDFVARLLEAPERCSAELSRRHSGVDRHFEITARVLVLDGERCIVASLRDLTLQREAEADRLNLETQLQQASKMEAIGQLAGGIAHDFNNILASIIGYTELAQATAVVADSAQVRNYLGEVVTAGQRARDLISQMLTFTRARRGTAVPTDVRQCIHDVSRMLRAAIPKTIDIRTDFAPDLPMIQVDPVQLQQVLINLLINSRDAIVGNGAIAISVRRSASARHCMVCDTAFGGEHVELSVADTGHGIPDDLLPRVFDMFVSTREPGGTGIGLWLVNTIVHEYGGHVTIETSNRGTTFGVFLPAESVSPARPAREARAPSRVRGHVVVVDDEVSVGNFIGEALRSAGYDAIVFNDAGAAIAHIERRRGEVALLLTDQAMPQWSGLDVAEAARATDADLPIVIVTGFAERTDKSRMARLGVDRLLTKPFRIDALLEAVHDLTRRAEPEPRTDADQ